MKGWGSEPLEMRTGNAVCKHLDRRINEARLSAADNQMYVAVINHCSPDIGANRALQGDVAMGGDRARHRCVRAASGSAPVTIRRLFFLLLTCIVCPSFHAEHTGGQSVKIIHVYVGSFMWVQFWLNSCLMRVW